MQIGVRFLARQDRTVAQVERYLESKGASPFQVRQAVRRLSDLSYLDDYAYAQRWVENRLVARPMGQERLKAELQAKGISEALANPAIADVFRQVQVDEEVLAHRALKGKQRHGRWLTRSQTMHLLRQRGFSQETIDRMIGEFGTTEERVYEE